MTSRERVRKALNHEVSDRVPIDLGSTPVTTIHALALKKLREQLGLEDHIITLTDPLLQCGAVEQDVIDALQIDCVGVWGITNTVGVPNKDFKRWTLPDGTEVLVSGQFAYTVGDDGALYAYAGGDMNYPPSAKMPGGGFYFDPIVRQEDLDAKTEWNARKDYEGMYRLFTDEELKACEDQSKDLFNNTQCSLVGRYDWGGLGDAFHVPGPWQKETPGVRNMPDWLMTMCEDPDYMKDLFDMQSEIAIENLKLYREAVGDRIDVIELSATDFAHQTSLMVSKEIFQDIFKPYYKRMNDWIHANTNWKIFIHSCGAITSILPDFIEAGFDILNPIQVSAKGMDAGMLKSTFGKDIVFWGGGCNPQSTMPTAKPEEVYEETRAAAKILSKGGGFIGGNIHNVQPDVPAENLLAELQALKDTVPEAE
ncbi:uroporphyrinogen decarboxylase family protein [Ruminococcus gauvreauii]|uniref:Methyltransferase n=1 Tax=Ruminococcus gauvreauii TaxID=438033 RepID=A0ABY5VKH7_9FIRM|nr:uroporphyrinogen decarboxylase family protein [Ruminococcus gauvreauii]UWP61109.1 methyltransferase [Ruminococcus gauvreauii]